MAAMLPFLSSLHLELGKSYGPEVSHEPFTDRLLFRELVHVVQYQMLGL